MTYTTILNLLACALDYSKISDKEIFDELEVLDENLNYFLDEENISDSLKLEFKALYSEVTYFLNQGNNIQRVKNNADNWPAISHKALILLDRLNIEIVSPDEFLERYDWEDGELWDGNVGTRSS